VVQPEDVWVVDPTTDAQLTLTTCTPKYSAQQRLVIKAALVADPSSAAARDAEPPLPRVEAVPRITQPSFAQNPEVGLRGEEPSLRPTFVWGVVTAAVGLGWWMLFRRYRHPLGWAAGLLPFLAVLLVFFVFLERALPAGY